MPKRPCIVEFENGKYAVRAWRFGHYIDRNSLKPEWDADGMAYVHKYCTVDTYAEAMNIAQAIKQTKQKTPKVKRITRV